ncbi:TIGR04282 family arsenosugar biosynthesis glycosyltransferase [Clostridioides mangenotii]|uniref:TIGR04282 family arsenosugar biosynthesis glycosyltransferase n=1 Tax=Metaclostridioides mangenotii TaxID=1540 RepID=UPI001C0F959C|nr:TIGR04282 family arsenosugar biosynthesis glycosyltransferase [Clostridioides mangenotii]MBU5306314.1 TIGR04282 family arsenosugar biosynthesis glycosyltransferase [Clostridioides mangenotii]
MKEAIIIFTRIPIPGRTKTRLQKCLTPNQCANLHKNFIKDIYNACKSTQRDIFVFYTPNEGVEILREVFGDSFKYYQQIGDDIGYRMANAIDNVLSQGYESCVLIGTDIPTIKVNDIINAFDELIKNDIVLKPTFDGGYCLIGMKKSNIDVFIHQSYGHSRVIENTIQNLNKLDLSYSLLENCIDIDEKEDLIYLWEHRRNIKYYCRHTMNYLKDIHWLSNKG